MSARYCNFDLSVCVDLENRIKPVTNRHFINILDPKSTVKICFKITSGKRYFNPFPEGYYYAALDTILFSVELPFFNAFSYMCFDCVLLDLVALGCTRARVSGERAGKNTKLIKKIKEELMKRTLK